MIKVPELSPHELEDRAAALLAAYEETSGEPIEGPVIPVDDIVMYQLSLRLDFADLHDVLRVPKQGKSPDILAAIFFDEDAILIDHSLHPERHPSQRGRYRFSVGHEACHWVCHRSAVLKNRARHGRPAIVCRKSEAKRAPIEWQAENFSSFLLLPRERVLDAWGQRPPFVFDVHEHASRELRKLWISLRPDQATARAMFRAECEAMFDQFAGPLAELFQVSKQAMQIRLEGVGLLRRSRLAAIAT